MDKQSEYCTLCILVKDIPGVLSQVARLFSRKGYNIHTIASAAGKEVGTTRMTIVIEADQKTGEQIAAQCGKLIPVLAVKILSEPAIYRECTMVKVETPSREMRDEVMQMANIFRASIIDVSRDALVLSLLGDREKTDAFLKLFEEYHILEIVRTGTAALERGRHTIYDDKKLKEEYNYGKNVLREGL